MNGAFKQITSLVEFTLQRYGFAPLTRWRRDPEKGVYHQIVQRQEIFTCLCAALLRGTVIFHQGIYIFQNTSVTTF